MEQIGIIELIRNALYPNISIGCNIKHSFGVKNKMLKKCRPDIQKWSKLWLEYHTASSFCISSSSSTPPNEGETIYRSAIRDNISWYDNPNLSFSLFENNIEIIQIVVNTNNNKCLAFYSDRYSAELAEVLFTLLEPKYLEVNTLYKEWRHKIEYVANYEVKDGNGYIKITNDEL